MKTDKLFYSLFLSQPSLINELIPTIPADCEFSYSAPVIKDTEFRLDGLLTPLSDNPNLPLIFLEAQMQKDTKFYGRYFAETFLYLYQYEVKRPWNGLLILQNRSNDLGSDIPYETLLNSNITRLYLEDLLSLQDLSPNLALLKLIVVQESEAVNLAQSVLNSTSTEQEFQRRLNLIEAILDSKFPQLSNEEILTMLDLKTAKMPSEPRLYKEVVRFWKEQGLQEGLQEGRQEGLQEGRQEGLQEGRQEGLQEGEIQLLIRQLTRRCGTLSDEVQGKIRTLSILELESLGEALLDFQGIIDLENWFNENNKN
ncbi:DUF2887 domain-containing protein [Geminocystis sp. GBBB08]|uniref:DUF2887 domain-containing protein n=1 Tax=Geminocystis sp. GBBB08 TaxID=2604140 RepID=UPI0027E2C6AB|nr:DUF2887 domain-containing protein [Geminocystis sp. GBBB08]MBL1210555.1 DUF2887 domain-containing protein [Geminocystis sp. GBBB08]